MLKNKYLLSDLGIDLDMPDFGNLPYLLIGLLSKWQREDMLATLFRFYEALLFFARVFY